MKSLVRVSNLWETVNNFSEILLAGKNIRAADKAAFEKMLVDRHKLPDRYANMFGLTQREIKNTSKLFTGEAITSGASKKHIMAEDSSRILRLLKPSGAAKKALAEGDREMTRTLTSYDGRKGKLGMFCCFNCSLSMWRNMASGGLRPARAMLPKGMSSLKLFRDGKGRWHGFPFYNTLYTLYEIDLSISKAELLYALPQAEAVYKNMKASDKYTLRRKLLIEKIMNKLS